MQIIQVGFLRPPPDLLSLWLIESCKRIDTAHMVTSFGAKPGNQCSLKSANVKLQPLLPAHHFLKETHDLVN